MNFICRYFAFEEKVLFLLILKPDVLNLIDQTHSPKCFYSDILPFKKNSLTYICMIYVYIETRLIIYQTHWCFYSDSLHFTVLYPHKC